MVKGAPQFKFFVGEENCATDKTVPNNPLCHGVGRALQHALYGNALHRMGNETCLGAASATLYGASGRQWEWPQVKKRKRSLSLSLCIVPTRKDGSFSVFHVSFNSNRPGSHWEN